MVKEEIRDLPTKAYIEERLNELEGKIEAKIKGLPTKDHFDTRMDELMKEVQDMREEQTLHQGQHDEITERLDTIEQKIGIQPL